MTSTVLDPARRRRRLRLMRRLGRIRPADVLLWTGALALAAASIWFPWDVAVNQARYGPPVFQFSRSGEVPADVMALREGRAPLFDMVAGTYVGDPPPRPATAGERPDPFTTAAVRLDDGAAPETADPPPGVDPITTASVPGADRNYTLIDAGRGLALIADADGIYIVRPGATLPDGRRVTAVVGAGPRARIVADDRSEVRLD